MRLTNLTSKDVTLRAHGGALLHFPRRSGGGARVPTTYGKSIETEVEASAREGVTVDSVDGPMRLEAYPEVDDGAHDVLVRAVSWSSKIDHLPEPREGVGYIVTSHVAEQAVIAGRSIDDLFVAVHIDREASDAAGRRVHASLCPASHASPSTRLLLAMRDGPATVRQPRTREVRVCTYCGDAPLSCPEEHENRECPELRLNPNAHPYMRSFL